MRFLITGGLGVNGSWLARTLLDRGHSVAVFENRDDTTLVADIADRIEVHLGDVRETADLLRAMKATSPDCVVHLAAIVAADQDPDSAVTINVGGVSAVCSAAVAAGVRRVVYTSSKGVYPGAEGVHGHPAYEPVPEDLPGEPATMYGLTKLAGEKVMAWFQRTAGLETVSLRFATIFGPGRLQRHAGSINTYSSLIENPLSGRSFQLDRGGDEKDGVIYVLDVVDAIATVATAPARPRHLVYNVASGAPVSLRDFARSIRRHVPDADIEIGPGLDPMKYDETYGLGTRLYLALDDSRFRQEFDWAPQYDLDRAIDHYYQTYLERQS